MIFSKLYQIIMGWASKQYAVYYLAFLSFIEAVILPFPPPDVLLAPIVLKQQRAFSIAFMTTFFSVLGGVVGYLLGYFAYEWAQAYLVQLGYLEQIDLLMLWFNQYGIWVIAIAGFSPLPYKLFTILAGFLNMALMPFILVSFLARGVRFFLVAFLVKKVGNTCDIWLKKYIDYLGYGLLLLLLIVYVFRHL